MNNRPLERAETDPTIIFEQLRGSYGTELLTAAVAEFGIIARLAERPLTFEQLCAESEIQPRPANVLVTALRAMGLLIKNAAEQLEPTRLAMDHLVPGGEFYVGDYVGLMAASPGVAEMVARLRSNRPAGADDDEGAAFIYREGIESAMEQEQAARHLTLSLAGRAKNVAPVLAENYPLAEAKSILDIGGGTGFYSIAYLRRFPQLRAQVLDRPEVLKVAEEMAEAYGVADRLELIEGDMFIDDYPDGADVVLLSNILHDWDVPQNEQLVRRCADVLPSGGRLLIHDVFLNDELDGPLPVALYSASLFTLTEGRAYSGAEYRSWLRAAGLQAGEITPTLIHCGVLPGTKG